MTTATLQGNTGMSKGVKILLAVLGSIVGLILLTVVVLITSYTKWHDYANQAEQVLQARLDANISVRANHYSKVQEMAQVPAMYAADLSKVFNGAIEGRYGADGSKAVFQFIQEHNPNFDPALYTQLSRVIEAGRNEFVNNEKQAFDMKAVYQTNIGNLWSGFWIKASGYPKMDLNAIKPVSTEKVNLEMETHISTPLQLR